VGWTLWRREPRGAWLLRHRRSAGIGSAAVLTLFVALAGPPSSGRFSDAAPGAVALSAPPPTGGTLVLPGAPPDRPQAEPQVRLERRTPPASRERRAVPRSRTQVMAPVPTAVLERGPSHHRAPNRTPGGGGTPTCEGPEATPSPTATPAAVGHPTATAGGAPASDVHPGTAEGCFPGGGEGGSTARPTGSGSPEPSG
jgi:hypothetical protein